MLQGWKSSLLDLSSDACAYFQNSKFHTDAEKKKTFPEK